MNGRIRGESTAVRRLSAAFLTKLSQLHLCSPCAEKRHMEMDYNDVDEFMQPFVLFELLNVCVKQAEDSLRMTDAQRLNNLVKLKNDLKKATELADQRSKFYE